MSTLKVDNIVAYSGTHVNGTFSGVFSGSFSSSRIDALEAFSSSLDNTFATDLVVNSLSGAFNSFTAALDNTYATDAQLYPILQATRSLELLSGSLIGITNGLMAFTAALDSTYATDEQLYQLYQATSSIHSTTSSLNEQTGSQDLVNLGISSVTGSLIGITNGLMAFTAALDSTYATDAQLLPLLQATASLNAKTGSYAVTGSNIFSGNQTISGSVNVSGSLNLSDIVFNETTMSAVIGKNLIIQTSYSGTIIGTETETATDNQGGDDTLTFVAWIEGSGGTDYPTIVNVQPNWKASGPGLSVGATVASVNTLVFSPGQSVYQITLNTGYGLFQTSQEYTFTEPDTSGTITKNWIFESGSNLVVPTGGNIIGAANLTTTGSNHFYGNQTISGSLNVTSSVNLSGSIVINQITYPTLTFGDGQYGVEVPTLGVNNTLTMEIPKTVYEYVKNDSGVTLPKGTPVHSVGTVGFNTLVIAASASVASTMPATYILAQDLDDEEEGLGIAIGAIQGVNTTGLIAGDPVWVGANGGWTQTKPTGSNLIQNLGIVTKVGVNGGGVVLGAGRSNDVPNIQEGYFWVGNSGSVATPISTSSFAVTSSSNIFYGNQTITGSLYISGSGSLNGGNIVSSNTIQKIETISSASYAALNPPVSGTLYIII